MWGLAKREAALKQTQLLGQVFMPKELPNALATGDQRRQSSGYPDRRHHYTWAWEDRRLLTTSTYGQAGKDVPLSNAESRSVKPSNFDNYVTGGSYDKFESHRTVTVPPQDPRLIYRIVGFVEYAEALRHLDQFVEEASVGEFEMGEEVIRSQDAFRIQTNLSRELEQRSSLSERSDNPRDDYTRLGLEWMLALARVELGAMLAGFTTHENPFLSLAPTVFRQERVKSRPFGSAAFAELLMDGLRTHYWSIVREDVVAKDFKSGVPENHLLTYGRRAMVGRQFLRAVLKYSGAGKDGENLPASQRKELESWDQTFLRVQRMMLYCLTFKVGHETTTKYAFSATWVGDKNEYYAPSSRVTTKRDETPDAMRRILETADPTLVGCPCR